MRDMDGEQFTDYRVVVIDPKSLGILTAASSNGVGLFRESVSSCARTASALTEALEQNHGLRTIQLAVLPQAGRQSYCAVHELICQPVSRSQTSLLIGLDDIASRDLSDDERLLIRRIMRGQADELGRFARLNWIGELFAMLGQKPGGGTTPVVRHVNQGIDFCLLSFRDSDGIVRWFKAVGEPNTREFGITAELACRFPTFLPRVLATFPEWNGWVMENIEGLPLNQSTHLSHCRQALTALATMQIEIASDVRSLFVSGAKAWTGIQIASLTEPFFAEARRAMDAQTSALSKPLAPEELLMLQDDLQWALREFGDSAIPNTLVHGDIGHGNIIASADGPVFLDWADTYIGHPFLCAEHLLADLARSNPIFSEKQDALRWHYARQWKDSVTTRQLEMVTCLAPAIAAFSYAVMAWEVNRYHPDPSQAWPLMRSMVRRTRNELEHAWEITQ